MGLMWDLIQHSQISDAKNHTRSLEQRVEMLEDQVRRNNEAFVQLLQALERRFGQDLDGDGRIG